MVVMVSAIPRVAWSARRTFSTGPPLIQREGPLDVRVGVARRLSHRYRDIYNTLTQGLASTCAVPPMHCVLAELERERDLIGYIKPTSCGFEAFAKDGRAI